MVVSSFGGVSAICGSWSAPFRFGIVNKFLEGALGPDAVSAQDSWFLVLFILFIPKENARAACSRFDGTGRWEALITGGTVLRRTVRTAHRPSTIFVLWRVAHSSLAAAPTLAVFCQKRASFYTRPTCWA